MSSSIVPDAGNIDSALNCTTTSDVIDNCPLTIEAETPGTSAALIASATSFTDALVGLYAVPVSPSLPVPVATKLVPARLEVAPIKVKSVLPALRITYVTPTIN